MTLASSSGSDSSSGPGTPWRVSAVVLPECEPREFWIVDGRITYARAAGAETLADKGFIVPGLVDAHCHIGLDEDGPVDRTTQETQALTDRDAGALLVRDAGSAADTRWIDDRADLPRIIRAGRHIARPKRYLRNYGVEIEPGELVDAVAAQAVRGDGWVKLVGDWIDRGVGDLAPLWPREALIPAIAKAHELGARVTAHVFGEESIPDLLDAGIDCLEHGTGLTPELLERMARDRVALVPTRLQVENFPAYASQGEAKFPAYARHIRALHARVDDMIGAAREAGVPLYAGTDAGGVLPHGLIVREIRALAERAGLGAVEALGAGSWRARAWLGLPAGIAEGAPADFVVYDENPLQGLGILDHPRIIVLRGRPVGSAHRST